jgi:hypothetical protein
VDVSTLIIGAVVGAAVGGLLVYLLSRLKNSSDYGSGQRGEVAVSGARSPGPGGKGLPFIHRVTGKGSSRKFSFRCIGFSETELPVLPDSRKPSCRFSSGFSETRLQLVPFSLYP